MKPASNLRALVLMALGACIQQAVAFVDCTLLIPEEAVLAGKSPVTDQEAGSLTVKELLHLPTDFRSLILVNRRILLEAKAVTLRQFSEEVSREVPTAPRMTARLVVTSINRYIEVTCMFGRDRKLPRFYEAFFRKTDSTSYVLSKAEQDSDIMLFVSLDFVGTPLYHSVDLSDPIAATRTASSFTRLNMAKRAVLEHLSPGFMRDGKRQKDGLGGRRRADELLDLASVNKELAPSVAVLRCLVLSANGEKAAAKKLANQYRTNQSLNIHYREGLLEMAKTGDWQKLRKAMDQPFIVGWKKGD